MSTANIRTGNIRQGKFSEIGSLQKYLTVEFNFTLEIFANSLPVQKFPSNENHPLYGSGSSYGIPFGGVAELIVSLAKFSQAKFVFLFPHSLEPASDPLLG